MCYLMRIMRILYFVEIDAEQLQTCKLDNTPLVKTAAFRKDQILVSFEVDQKCIYSNSFSKSY